MFIYSNFDIKRKARGCLVSWSSESGSDSWGWPWLHMSKHGSLGSRQTAGQEFARWHRLSLKCPFNYMLCGAHITQTHRQNNSDNKAAASREQVDIQQWQRLGKNERKCLVGQSGAQLRESLKDTEMRATVYLAGRLKLQNGDERRAGKGLKAYRPACAIASYIIWSHV